MDFLHYPLIGKCNFWAFQWVAKVILLYGKHRWFCALKQFPYFGSGRLWNISESQVDRCDMSGSSYGHTLLDRCSLSGLSHNLHPLAGFCGRWRWRDQSKEHLHRRLTVSMIMHNYIYVPVHDNYFMHWIALNNTVLYKNYYSTGQPSLQPHWQIRRGCPTMHPPPGSAPTYQYPSICDLI